MARKKKQPFGIGAFDGARRGGRKRAAFGIDAFDKREKRGRRAGRRGLLGAYTQGRDALEKHNRRQAAFGRQTKKDLNDYKRGKRDRGMFMRLVQRLTGGQLTLDETERAALMVEAARVLDQQDLLVATAEVKANAREQELLRGPLADRVIRFLNWLRGKP